jgi:hypothetical protein
VAGQHSGCCGAELSIKRELTTGCTRHNQPKSLYFETYISLASGESSRTKPLLSMLACITRGELSRGSEQQSNTTEAERRLKNCYLTMMLLWRYTRHKAFACQFHAYAQNTCATHGAVLRVKSRGLVAKLIFRAQIHILRGSPRFSMNKMQWFLIDKL